MDTRKRIPCEEQLQACWRECAGTVLRAEPGGAVRVRYPGMSRGASGPDFKDAVLETERGAVVCGDIEVHVDASDWYGHGHSRDPAYENVVLHVVASAGRRHTLARSGRRVPVAVVPGTAEEPARGLGCSGLFRAEPERVDMALRAAGYERLSRRGASAAARIRSEGVVEALGGLVARVLGYSANAEPLQRLGEHVCRPGERAVLCRMTAEDRRREVLRLAGLPPPVTAHGPEAPPPGPAVDPATWRLTGIYPNNGPVRRIVALADMLPELDGIAADMVRWVAHSASSHRDAERRFIVPGDGYWRRQCDAGRRIPDADLVGRSKASAIVVEAVLPWLYGLSVVSADGALRRHVVERCSSYPGPRPNGLVCHMARQLGLPLRGATALTAQGLVHLLREYCTRGLCCVCPLGTGAVGENAS